MLLNYHHSYHKESVLREILHMPVLVDRPSLAVDEFIVTHTVMLSDFYTPTWNYALLVCTIYLRMHKRRMWSYLSIAEQFWIHVASNHYKVTQNSSNEFTVVYM